MGIDVIALHRQLRCHFAQGRQRIQSKRMGHVPTLAGVGRQHDPNGLCRIVLHAQLVQTQHPIRDEIHTRCIGAVCETAVLQRLVPFAGLFKADDAAKQTAIHLGQHDMHRQIGGRQPPL